MKCYLDDERDTPEGWTRVYPFDEQQRADDMCRLLANGWSDHFFSNCPQRHRSNKEQRPDR